MPEAALNLAAYGVAFSLAWLVESPIMMLLTASNSLVRDRQSYFALRRFASGLNAAVTAVMVIVVVPPVFGFVAGTLMGLPPEVARLVHIATAILIPWPAAIGYRRFYQGILVRHGLTRRVAYGTVVRLASMSLTAAALALWPADARARASAAPPSPSAWWSRPPQAAGWRAAWWRRIAAEPDGVAGRAPADAARHRPLLLPARAHVDDLARHRAAAHVLHGPKPYAHRVAGRRCRSCSRWSSCSAAAASRFRKSASRSSGRHHEHRARGGARVAASWRPAATIALAVILFTPLADAWLRQVSGLSPELAEFSLLPARLLLLLPAMEYWLSFQRSRFILTGQTRAVTVATACEVGGIGLVLSSASDRSA